MSSDSLRKISALLDGVELELLVDERDRVTGARHSGASPELAPLLDALTRMGVGWPLSEWRAHGALRLEYSFRPEPKFAAGRGLVSPETAPPTFGFVQRLIRALPRGEAANPSWSPPESARWRALPPERRREKIRDVLRSEAARLGWKAEPDVRLDRSSRRWLLWFPEGAPPLDFHRSLLFLERRVRAETDSTVELLLEGKEDRNQRSSREIRDAKPHDLHPGA